MINEIIHSGLLSSKNAEPGLYKLKMGRYTDYTAVWTCSSLLKKFSVVKKERVNVGDNVNQLWPVFKFTEFRKTTKIPRIID